APVAARAGGFAVIADRVDRRAETVAFVERVDVDDAPRLVALEIDRADIDAAIAADQEVRDLEPELIAHELVGLGVDADRAFGIAHRHPVMRAAERALAGAALQLGRLARRLEGDAEGAAMAPSVISLHRTHASS